MKLLMTLFFWTSTTLFFAAVGLAYHNYWRLACGSVALSWLTKEACVWATQAYREYLDREAAFCRAKSMGIPL